jgi:hypothetical protein
MPLVTSRGAGTGEINQPWRADKRSGGLEEVWRGEVWGREERRIRSGWRYFPDLVFTSCSTKTMKGDPDELPSLSPTTGLFTLLGSSVMDSFRESRGKKEITISNGCCQKWG